MTAKKRSIVKFVFVAILAVLGIVLSVCSFPVVGTDYVYNGFANSISLGLDLSGGLSVVYDCSLNSSNGNLNDSIDATVTRLQQILLEEDYSEATVKRQGTSKIRIEVPSASETDEIFTFLENPQTLSMTLEQATDGKEPQVYISGSDIEDVYVNYNTETSQYGVSLDFTSEGSEKFSQLSLLASQSESHEIYIYLGDVSGTPWNTVTCEEQITGGSTFISGDSLSTYEGAREYAYNIMSGTFGVTLTLVENSVISATLGKEALTLGIIAGIVAFVLVMAIMWWRYGDFGLLANFALVIYAILMLFFLQAIPFIQLTLPGIAGIILSLGMAVDGNVIIFERIKEEYASGKKIHIATKSGFKRAFWPIFDSNITTIVTSIILYILGSASIKGFAIPLLLGILLSMFTCLVVTRGFVKWYLPLNSTKAKRLRLYRDKSVVEIAEVSADGSVVVEANGDIYSNGTVEKEIVVSEQEQEKTSFEEKGGDQQ